ncbi:MAG: SDR family oxidoreductase [Verrucomicrobiota bacterium]
MNLGLQDKAVIVLASSAGLGKATALEFAREGANVMLFSRREKECLRAKEEIESATGREPACTVGDAMKADDLRAVVRNTVEAFGRVDALVNNTGGPPAGTFDQFDDAAWQAAFELTLLSYVRVIREVLPHMRKAGGGRIVNFTSSSVRSALDNLILSNAFRMGVVGLTKTLAHELGRDNILINVLGPGRFATDRVKSLDAARAGKSGLSIEQVQQEAMKAIPLGRYGKPEEFARTAVFLCSGANTFITGQTLLVDGGMVRAY